MKKWKEKFVVGIFSDAAKEIWKLFFYQISSIFSLSNLWSTFKIFTVKLLLPHRKIPKWTQMNQITRKWKTIFFHQEENKNLKVFFCEIFRLTKDFSLSSFITVSTHKSTKNAKFLRFTAKNIFSRFTGNRWGCRTAFPAVVVARDWRTACPFAEPVPLAAAPSSQSCPKCPRTISSSL